MTAVFPYLPGLAFPVDRVAGSWDTTREVAVSGKETRYANRTQARRKYTVDIEGLDASGAHGSITSNSLQQLEAFFNSCLGAALIFNFWDVDDNSATSQQFGVGDGATTAFQLVRAAAGYVDNVFAPLNASAPILVPSASGGQVYAPNNLLTYSNTLTNAAWTNSNITVSTGVADPLGGTAASTLTATAAGSFEYENEAPGSVTNFVNSIWARRRTGTGVVNFYSPAYVASPMALTSSWQRFSLASGPQNPSTAFFGLYLYNSGDQIDVYAPQMEASTLSTPGAALIFADPFSARREP